MSIGYIDVRVSPELLAELNEEKQEATGWGAYAKFKQRLFYRNLNRWQKQGHHFNNEVDATPGHERVICTCGFYLHGSSQEFLISPDVAHRVKKLKLDPIQLVRGHKSMDDFESQTCALIVNFVWESRIGDYLWTAYCQECGEIVVKKRNDVAKRFVAAHNAECWVRHG